MRLMAEGEGAATEQQIFMCLMCQKSLAGSFTEMNEETAVQRCDWLQHSRSWRR